MAMMFGTVIIVVVLLLVVVTAVSSASLVAAVARSASWCSGGGCGAGRVDGDDQGDVYVKHA